MTATVPNSFRGNVGEIIVEETTLVAAGNILSEDIVVGPNYGIVMRFTVACSDPAILSIVGWASFPLRVNNVRPVNSMTFVLEVYAGMELNVHSDRAGVFKVIASQVIGGVI